jgi:hypothetical protein
MEYELKDEDYLNLWKYFQDKAISVKGAMFNTITWIIGFAAALLGFIFAKISDFDPMKAKIITLPLLMILLSIAGIVICIYAFFAIGESAKHIRKNWDRRDRCMNEIKGLNKIIIKEAENKTNIIEIWNQLRIVVSIFLVSFIAILVWGLIIKC